MLLIFALSLLFPTLLCEECEGEWISYPRLQQCLLIPHHPLPWEEANTYCTKKGGNLASIHTHVEREILERITKQHNPQFLTWIGLYRIGPASYDFAWSDDSVFNFSLFKRDEPAQFGNCVAISPSKEDGGWKAIDCIYSQFFVCKKFAERSKPIIMTQSHGFFNSPHYPLQYNDNEEQYYFIELEKGSRIMITFDEVETEEDNDYIQIFDGPDEQAMTIARLSGSSSNRTYLSKGNDVMIIFKSDESVTAGGFTAEYSKWEEPAIIEIGGEGIMESPNYPSKLPLLHYQHFIIRCLIDSQVQIKLTDFHSSVRDRLIFHDGGLKESKKLVTLSGSHHFLPVVFRSSYDIVYGVFEARDNEEASGPFRFEYSCAWDEGSGGSGEEDTFIY